MMFDDDDLGIAESVWGYILDRCTLILQIVSITMFFLFVLQYAAHADDNKICGTKDETKSKMTNTTEPWITLLPEQRLFAAGAYAIDPSPPTGLPYGDGAVLVKLDNGFGVVLFTDSSLVKDTLLYCNPLTINPLFLKDLMRIGEGAVLHESQ